MQVLIAADRTVEPQCRNQLTLQTCVMKITSSRKLGILVSGLGAHPIPIG